MRAPRAQELQAAPGWRSVELISDLHLQPSEPATFEAWRRYLADTDAGAVFLLGDLFEAWIGDDAIEVPGFAADAAAVLKAAASLRPLFFLHGNRDFLIGASLMAATGVTLLADPTVLGFAGRRFLLTHGDALCLEDRDYLAFREVVRAPAWQRDFLARPLAEREAIARGMRTESEAAKQRQAAYADVDATAAADWLAAADADWMIHGHTHRPAEHALPGGRHRIVLTDWDAAARPPRLEVLRITADGAVQRLPLAG